MAELIKRADGDALSKLIQFQAGRYEVRLAWTGNGVADLLALLNAYAVQARMSKHLWTGTRELMMMPEFGTLPEPLQAQICSIILGANALVDLDTEDHAKRLALMVTKDKPKGIA